MLDDQTKNVIIKKFKELKNPVKLIFSVPEGECEYCADIESLYEELEQLSNGKLSIENGSEKENTPVTLIQGKEKTSIRFHGIPAGHEFTPFLQTIIDVSKGEPGVSSEFKKKIKIVDYPVHIKVFVSPNCPYCSAAMKIANDLALLNKNITADVYEVGEFRELSAKYNVMGVPKTVINEIIELNGAYPPDIVVQKILGLKK